MQTSNKFIPYDWFKMIVALLLIVVIIFLWMNLPEPSPVVTTPEAVAQDDATDIVEIEPTETATATVEPTATHTNTATATSEPSATPTKTATATTEPTPTATKEPELTLPPFPEPSDGLSFDTDSKILVDIDGNPLYRLTDDKSGWVPLIPAELNSYKEVSSTDEYTWALLEDDGSTAYYWDPATHSWLEVPADQVQQEEELVEPEPLEIADCPKALPSRIAPGDQVKVLVNLNFRSSPDINEDNWITTMLPGTQLFVLGDTTCTDYDFGSYLWWQVEREDGSVGWSAEGAATATNYFLEPVESP